MSAPSAPEFPDYLPAAAQEALRALPAEQQTRLLLAISAEAERQEADLDAAVERSLQHIPALLRGSVRRLLGV
ncbi:MAG: hypothetical protein Q8J78_05975 [Moraxellaceae bacterium]|nr:hypothetical protein [Moraxellaceae bacterium]